MAASSRPSGGPHGNERAHQSADQQATGGGVDPTDDDLIDSLLVSSVDPGLMPAGADAHHETSVDPDATETLRPPDPTDRPGWHVRLFGSQAFFRLWLAQVVASLGDWCGFLAIAFLAAELSEASPAGAIGLVMTARILPGFFLAPLAGVLVDRLDRRQVMIACNLGRAAIVVLLPFVPNLAWLVLASFALEAFALMWSPAKEATVPNLVPHDHLTTANSLGMAAAYGTFPLASAVFALLTTVSVWVSNIGVFDMVRTDHVAVAFYFQAVAFCVSALLIRSIPIGGGRRRPPQGQAGAKRRRVDLADGWAQFREGLHYIALNHTVRAVNLGLATGLIGGGMLIPLGVVFAADVLDAGAAGYSYFVTALGFGVAGGIVAISVLQKHLDRTKAFTRALALAGVTLFAAASSPTIGLAVVFVAAMGAAAGPIYVLGFALLQSEVSDEVRGRVIASLNTLVRLCVLLSMVVGPYLSDVLDRVSMRLVGGSIEIAGFTLDLPGVRLTLWLAAVIIMVAGVVARRTLRRGADAAASSAAAHPAGGSRSGTDGKPG
ncbi:MAG: MFS transporter [Acidimicrobiia bacterium]|nr:MFS transporter [Acidimicrobiia bacterium]